ncbi:hypothetical protein acdb102_27360 [Acidothermaceae bacterium B102]|nr:hypothetical protein acdb102_27360 [Acidothermaceae bacterium B102]
MPSAGRSALRGLLGLTVAASMVGLSAPAAFAAHRLAPKVVVTAHVGSVVAKRQASGAPLGSVSVTGRITPARTGRVVLQREAGSRWKDIGNAGLTSKAAFTVRGTALPVGRLVLRVLQVKAGSPSVTSARFSLLVKAPVVVDALPQPPSLPAPTPTPVPVPPAPVTNPDPPVALACTPALVGDPKTLAIEGLYDGYGYVGRHFAAAVTVFDADQTYTVTAVSPLPPGLLLVAGSFVGVPTTSGVFTVTVSVTDPEGHAVTGPVCAQFADPLVIATTVGQATAGQSYAAPLGVTGGFLPLTWRDQDAGLAEAGLTTTEGSLQGVPSTVGIHEYQLRVTDGAGTETGAVVTLTVGPLPVTARTIAVPRDAATIQAAIDAAAVGDTVLVSPGTYRENLSFHGKAITVASVAGAASTVIDGGGRASTISFVHNEPRQAVLQGFTVRNGDGSFDGATDPYQPIEAPGAGGINIVDAGPTITDDVITANVGSGGGGISADGGSPAIVDDTISNNVAYGAAGGFGGGIGLRGTIGAQVMGDVVTGNSFRYGSGSGIGLVDTEATLVEGSQLTHNTTYNDGATLYVHGGGLVQVVDDVLAANYDASTIILLAGDTLRLSLVGDTISDDVASSLGMQGYLDSVVVRDTVMVGINATVFCGNWGTVPATFDHDDLEGEISRGQTMSSSCGDYSAAHHDLTSVPTFVPGTYVPAAGSALVDAGASDDLQPSTDIAGAPRISDGNGDGVATVDIGAYERP